MHRICSPLVVVLAGCNAVYGLDPTVHDFDAGDGDALRAGADRDRDGILDPEDACIAGIADRLLDAEGDALTNEMDPCPFDYESADGDADNIYDECDPLYQQGNDRKRCVMVFANPSINLELWTPRDATSTWSLIETYGLIGSAGTVVAGESFEGPATTSYDLTVYPGTLAAEEGAVTLWLRTSMTGSAADVGCEVRGNASGTKLTVRGAAGATMTLANPLNALNKIQATVVPGAASGQPNVRCVARFGVAFPYPALSAAVDLPAGTLGFATESTSNTIFSGLSILERDDAPAL